MTHSLRPYVICHSLCSVDGRIKHEKWGVKNVVALFEDAASTIEVDAWVVGRITMEGFSAPKREEKLADAVAIPKTDYVGKHDARTYAVVIDPSGKCHWDSNMVTTEHVIEVLSERVSSDYLHHLQSKNVSYVFAGKDSIDLSVALHKLQTLFGITRVRIDGGGKVNGSFLKAGLIDEISLIVVPVADGSVGTPTVFDAEAEHGERVTTPLRLESAKTLEDGALWLRYKIIGI